VARSRVLVDGNQKIPNLPGFLQTCLVKGDQRAHPIAAASILAKVARDEKITEIGQIYPQYGFHEHKAYGTKEHREAIAKHGPCPEHRRSFAGVREHWRDIST
jgi:ribonuclease HII